MNTLEVAGESVDRTDIELFRFETLEHYRHTLESYALWSPAGDLHFGYWRWGMNPLNRKQMLSEMNRQIIQSLDLHEHESGDVLDLGCGVGGFSRWGSNLYPQLSWKAINVSVEQLAAAKQFPNPMQGQVEYLCEDYHQLSQPSHSAIGACFVESLCYSEVPQHALTETARVLRSGTRLAIADGFVKQPLECCSTSFRKLHDLVANNWAVPRYHQLMQIHAAAMQAGFRIVDCRELSWRIAFSAIQSLPLTLLCAAKLVLRSASSTQWRHLIACACALMLGLQRSKFGYYLIVLEK